MIRVIYRWRVEDNHHEEFVKWWHEGTLRILSNYTGAMGSTLCNWTPPGDEVVAVARWKSLEDLRRFWQDPGGSEFPWAMKETVEVLEELDHLTNED
jgi:heme-degrading monooxygenase HmoA